MRRVDYSQDMRLDLGVLFIIMILIFESASSNADILKIPRPYILELQCIRESAKGSVIVDDIDGDFDDEILFWEADELGLCRVTYYKEDMDYVDEEFEIGEGEFYLYATDWDAQGEKEIVIAQKMGDKVYLRLMSPGGKNINWPFIAVEGQDNNGDGRWDGSLRPQLDMRINSDSYNDVICTVVSHRDRTPRGVAAFDIWNGERLWEYPAGTRVEKIFSANLDGIGDEEIICTSYAPSSPENMIRITDTDDAHSYIIALRSDGQLYWKVETGGMFSGVHAVAGDLNNDGTTEVVISTYSQEYAAEEQSSEKRNRISILDGQSGAPTRTDFHLSSNTSCLRLEDILQEDDGGRRLEILVGTWDGRILLLDNSLCVVKQKHVLRRIDHIVVGDLNGDDENEIVVTMDSPPIETAVLNTHLKVMARYSNGGEPFLLKRSETQSRLLLRTNMDLKIVTLEKNPERLRFVIFWAILLLILSVSFFVGFKTKQSRSYLSRLREDVANDLAIGFVLLDKKGNIINLNNSAQSILGIEKKEFMGRGHDVFLKNENVKVMYDVIDESIAAVPQRAVRREIGVKSDGERREILTEIVPLLDKKSRDLGRLILLQDITALSHSRRITAWGAMAQRLAHKIKNPLSTMRLALQRMQTVAHQTLDDEGNKFDRYIEANLDEINRLLKMTDDFMKFADLKPPKFQPTDINRLITGVLDKYADSFSDRIRLHLNLEQSLHTIKADQEQVETVFENLITNALAAIETQGSINISTSFVQRFQEEFVKLAARDYVRIEISDTGRGIPSGELDRLFDPFYSRTVGGTGLGLAIVKKIVEDHQGLINVDSTEGVGTTFAIFFPVKEMGKT